MRRLIGTLSLGCLMFVFLAADAAEPTTLRVSSIVVPPLVVLNPETGAVEGSAVEAVIALGRKCNISTKVVITPSWKRAYVMAQIGIVDAIIPTNFSKDRLAYFDFPKEPLVDMSPSLIVRKDSPVTAFTSLDILKDKRVGIRANALLESKFDAYVRTGKAILVERSDSPSLVDELLSGRVDFIVDSPAMINYHMTKSEIPERIRVLKPPLGKSGQFLALSKKRATPFAPGTALSRCLLDTSVRD